MARARSRPEPRRVSLGDDIRIGRAREVFAQLVEAAPAKAIVIDAAQVARVDAAGLQAIVAALARLRTEKVACEWAEVSPIFASSAALAGLTRILELP